MSSNITTVFNQMISMVGAQLSTHKRLNDPYNLEENPEMLLRKGWGVRIGPGVNSERCISPEYYLNRTFEVVIVREAVAKDSDPSRREASHLELLEDLHTILDEAVSENTLYNSAVNIKYVSDGGLDEIFVFEKPYNLIVAQFTVEYSQNVTGA